jgi:hypothetical protein
MIDLLGFAPDANEVTPGLITDCENFIPYNNGMEGGPSGSTPADVPALASECLGAAVVENLAGARRVIAGAATKLYELNGGVWLDVSGSAYHAGSDTRWMIAQFGDATLAANKGDKIQRSTSGAFATIASAPKAEIIFSVGFQVMALNVNDGADKPDAWYCSALNDDTDWTTSLTTQCAIGRLVGTAGAITAGARLGEYAVAYKQKSIYLGRYVGSPDVWDWTQVPGGDAGCVGKDAICDVGGAHFFVGNDNFWFFDGTAPRPVENAPRQWFSDFSSPQFRYRTKCVFDRQKNRVWIFYPSVGSDVCDSALVHHLGSKKWGRSNRTIEAALNYVSPGVTYDTWSSMGSTFDTLPNIAYDAQFWVSGGQALSAFNSSHQLQFLNGPSASSSFTTGDIGDDEQFSQCSSVRLRYAQGYAPTTASVQMLYKMNSWDSPSLGPVGTVLDGKFDVLQNARWHRAIVSFTGPVRVTGANANIKPSGAR